MRILYPGRCDHGVLGVGSEIYENCLRDVSCQPRTDRDFSHLGELIECINIDHGNIRSQRTR